MRRYFSNKSVNRLYIHKSTFAMAERIGWIFGPIFLLKIGYTVPEALTMWAALFMMRIPLRYLYARTLHVVGLKKGLLGGLFFFGAAMMFLPYLETNIDLLAPFLLLYSIGMTLYWTAFHTIFGMLGDAGDRGKQVAMLNVLIQIVTSVVPLISGAIAYYISYQALFYLAALLMAAASVPVLPLTIKTPEATGKHSKKQREACRWLATFHFFYAIKDYAHTFLWRITLFTMLGNVLKFGGVLTLGLLILSMVQLFIGSAVDKGRGYFWLKIGAVITFLQMLARAFWVTTPMAAAASEAMSVGNQMMMQAETNLYNRGKDVENYFYYIYWGEVAWDLGSMLTLLAMAGLAFMGMQLQMILITLAPIGLLGYYIMNMKLMEKAKA